jgi:hypothetical protein
MTEYEDEFVSVALIREDLRVLLVAAQLLLDKDRDETGVQDERLALAIQRVGSTASSAEWQPKPKKPDE